MKDVIIIMSVLIMIIGCGIYLQKYTKYSSDEIIKGLSTLKNDIKVAEETNNNEKAKQKADEIYNKWQELEEKWSVIVLHDELDLIETSLVSMKTNIEVKDFDTSVEKVEESIFLLNHIYEKEKFCLKNIF